MHCGVFFSAMFMRQPNHDPRHTSNLQPLPRHAAALALRNTVMCQVYEGQRPNAARSLGSGGGSFFSLNAWLWNPQGESGLVITAR